MSAHNSEIWSSEDGLTRGDGTVTMPAILMPRVQGAAAGPALGNVNAGDLQEMINTAILRAFEKGAAPATPTAPAPQAAVPFPAAV